MSDTVFYALQDTGRPDADWLVTFTDGKDLSGKLAAYLDDVYKLRAGSHTIYFSAQQVVRLRPLYKQRIQQSPLS